MSIATAKVYYMDGTSISILYDQWSTLGNELVFVFGRSGYPDVIVPLFNVKKMEMGK